MATAGPEVSGHLITKLVKGLLTASGLCSYYQATHRLCLCYLHNPKYGLGAAKFQEHWTNQVSNPLCMCLECWNILVVSPLLWSSVYCSPLSETVNITGGPSLPGKIHWQLNFFVQFLLVYFALCYCCLFSFCSRLPKLPMPFCLDRTVLAFEVLGEASSMSSASKRIAHRL